MKTVSCDYVLAAPGTAPLSAHDITYDGATITGVQPGKGGRPRLLALPPLVNAHDHGRAVRVSSIGGGGKPLETWLNYLALFPSVDPYLAAFVSLSHSAMGGVGTVMMHYTRAQGFTDLPTEVKEVARAASDVGIRVGFAVSMKDRNPLVYGPSEPILAALPPEARAEVEKRYLRKPLTPAEYIALADAVADAAASPTFDVQYGPNAVQWCSEELLKAVADASARTGRRIHMHLLESRYQRAWLDKNYPQGVVKYLDSIGFLSPRLTLAHCVWARPDELELLAARGVTIAVNHSSNLHLRSGIAPVAKMLAAGARVAIGVDAIAFDEDDDALREMRVAHLLQTGNGFDVQVGRPQILAMALENGHLSVMNKARSVSLAAGQPADLLLLNWDEIDSENLRGDLDPLDLLFARTTARHIDELIVNGRSVTKKGKILGGDYDAARRDVLDRMRAGLGHDPLAAALPPLERAIAAHYHDAPCC
jgi:cytosine/adenosine deaminase-related metal-dependent hydrolase